MQACFKPRKSLLLHLSWSSTVRFLLYVVSYVFLENNSSIEIQNFNITNSSQYTPFIFVRINLELTFENFDNCEQSYIAKIRKKKLIKAHEKREFATSFQTFRRQYHCFRRIFLGELWIENDLSRFYHGVRTLLDFWK